MEGYNPYAPSRATLKAATVTGSSGGVRREGKWIVMPADGALPHRCVKCNGAPDDPTRERNLRWHHPAIYLLVLFNMLIYIIVAALVSKKAKVSPALCTRHKSRRRNAILYTWLGILASIILGFVTAGLDSAAGWLLFSVALFIVSGFAGIVRSRLLYAKKIDLEYVRLGGAGREYLDSLPG